MLWADDRIRNTDPKALKRQLDLGKRSEFDRRLAAMRAGVEIFRSRTDG